MDIVTYAIAGISAIGGGVLAYMMASKKKNSTKKSVLLLRPRDHRGDIIPVEKETVFGLSCKKTNGVNYNFFKYGPSWNFKDGIRFLAVEGSVYTARVSAMGEEIRETLANTLKMLWGEETYMKLPKQIRAKVEDGTVGVIVKPTPINEEEGIIPMSQDDLLNEEDAEMLKRLTEGEKIGTTAKDMLFVGMAVICGVFAGYLIAIKGMI